MWDIIPVKAKQSRDKCIRKCTERVLCFLPFCKKKKKQKRVIYYRWFWKRSGCSKGLCFHHLRNLLNKTDIIRKIKTTRIKRNDILQHHVAWD